MKAMKLHSSGANFTGSFRTRKRNVAEISAWSTKAVKIMVILGVDFFDWKFPNRWRTSALDKRIVVGLIKPNVIPLFPMKELVRGGAKAGGSAAEVNLIVL
jgi:hypothetical protein